MTTDSDKHYVTAAELREQLVDSVRFLLADCREFDAGDGAYAKRISNTLRLLLKQSRRSTALLQQLGHLSCDWFDVTRGKPLRLNPYGGCSLFSISVQATVLPTGFGPPENKVHAELVEPTSCSRSPFEQWWNATVAHGVSGEEFSRRNFVEHLGQKDGGTHVDSQLEPQYIRIKLGSFMAIGSRGDNDSIVMTLGSDSGNLFRDGHWAAIRTIAHEVLLTIHSEAPYSFVSPYRWRDSMGKRFEVV